MWWCGVHFGRHGCEMCEMPELVNVEVKMEKYIESAEKIIRRDGNCRGVKCSDCPFHEQITENHHFYGASFESDNSKRLKWFENWIKENTRRMVYIKKVPEEIQDSCVGCCFSGNFISFCEDKNLYHACRDENIIYKIVKIERVYRGE